MSKNKNSDKDEILQRTMLQIDKEFGKGSIMLLGTKDKLECEIISTGSLTLDLALGIGGIPRGRVSEIYGPESSGKTTLTLHIIAEAQKNGGKAAFIDAENALDAQYASALGVDIDNLLISQPSTGEEALEITELLIRSGTMDVIVIDSVAALVPRAEIEGDMGDSHMGLQARLMSQALRKLSNAISKSHTALIFINQTRMKIGIMFGNPETTTGGIALKFYSSIRLDIRRIAQIKSGDVILGNRTRVKVVKNKLAAPFRKAEFDIIYGKGIYKLAEILDLAVENDIINKAGTWYSYEDIRLGQGRDNSLNFLKENPTVREEIENKLKIVLGLSITEEITKEVKKEKEKEKSNKKEDKK